MWALHGHSHDAADHDHTQALILTQHAENWTLKAEAARHRAQRILWSTPFYLLERPPRT